VTGGPFPIRIARGPRAVEAGLLSELEGLIDAGLRDPRQLDQPVRVVLPSRSLREHLSATLVRKLGRALVGVSVQTLYALALEIFRRAKAPLPIGEGLFPILVRQLAREEPALREGLEGLVDGYGVVEADVSDLLDAGFEEAHAEGVEEALAELDERGELGDWARAVVRVAARVSALLAGRRAGHRSSLFRGARELLEREPERVLPARALLLHGFADATGVQADLIEALLRLRGAHIWLDRPPDPAEPAEEDLGVAFGRQFCARLVRAAGGTETQVDSAEPAALRVLHAPGPHAELRSVALRLRALLDAGAVPERIGVAARHFGGYRVPLRLHFDRLGIPFSGLGERGPAGAPGRRLLALLTLLHERERAPAERWLDALAGLEGAGAFGAGLRADLRLALHALGAARVDDVASLDGRKGRGASREIPLPTRSGLWAPPDGEAPRAPRRTLPRADLEAAVSAARSLCQRWSRWPEIDCLSGHFARLRALLEQDLCWGPGLPEMAELDAAALDAEEAEPGDLALDDFALFLERQLQAAGSTPLGGEGAGVQVLGVMEARARTFDHLFLIGMNRDLFPRAITEDPLLPDALRRRLRVVMPDLPIKSDGFDEERFLFAQLAAASECVTLSCSISDDDGKARPISPLVERLRWAEHVGEPERVPAVLSVRDSEAPLRPAHEHALLAGHHGTREQFGHALRVALEEVDRDDSPDRVDADWGPVARARLAVLAELDPDARRRRELGPYYGFVGAAREPADPRRAPLFVTAVENAARCPWQAFLVRLLRIEPPPDALDALPGVEPRLLGSLVHETLEQIVREQLAEPVESLERALAREAVAVRWPDDAALAALLHERAESLLREEGIALSGFARVLAMWARPHLDAARELDWPGPGSGMAVVGAELRGALAIRDREGAERGLHFKVDRVDRVETGLRLVDYKTGKPLSSAKKQSTRVEHHRKQVARGLQLQAVAYALAAESAGAGDAEGRYLYLDPDPTLPRVFACQAGDADFAPEFERAVGAVVEAIDRGSFFPRLAEAGSGEEPGACQYCEVSEACLRGDSGARTRLAEWSRRAVAPSPPEQALLRLWQLGSESA
jgi:RecB family exonuclease